MTDPTAEHFLRVRAWAHEHRRELIAMRARASEIGTLLDRLPLTAAREEHAASMVEQREWLEGGIEEVGFTIEQLDRAHVVSFPNVGPDVFSAATTASHELVGVPDPFSLLPFPVCYVGFGPGVHPDSTVTGAPMDWMTRNGLTETASLGVLASREGHIVPISGFGSKPGVWRDVFACPVWRFGECEPKDLAFGWLLYILLRAMEGHRPERVPPATGLVGRRAIDRAARAGARRVATPYYTVRVDGRAVRTAMEAVLSEERQPVDWSHRWDVRKHQRSRFLRGYGDVPYDVARKLMERGYEVYFAPEPEIDEELAARGLPVQQPGEWVARKRWSVSEHVRGPEDKPYVPSARVVTQGPRT